MTEDVRRWSTAAVLGLCLLLPASSAWADDAGPRLVVEGPVFDFGSVDRGTPVEHVFRVTNPGGILLRIEHVKSSCGCTVAAASGDVSPGGQGQITVHLDTERLAGRTSKTVTVYTNDPTTPTMGITLTGQVVADLVVTPMPLYLGKVRRGEVVHRELRVTPGRPDRASQVTSVQSGNPSIRTKLESLPEGGGQRIVVDLARDIPLGRFNDELVLSTTSATEPELKVPVFGSVEGDVVVLPSQVSFGVAQGGDVPPRELFIRNQGDRPLAVTRVKVRSDVASYELEPIKAGVEYRLTLRLRDGLPAGRVEEAVEIFTDDPDEERVVVPLYAIVRPGRGRS
jgi:hypothetical protein